MSLSKESCLIFLNFIQRRIKITDLQKWIYENINLESELERDDYFKLLEFQYSYHDAHYMMDKILYGILDKYIMLMNNTIKQSRVMGICLSNEGHYHYSDEDVTFCIKEDKRYDIFDIFIKKDLSDNNYIEYVIMDENDDLYYVPSSIFKIEHTELPDDWIIEENERSISLTPKDFNYKYYKGKNSFWEDFHDDIEEALIIFAMYLYKHGIDIPDRFKIYYYKALCQ